MKSQVLQYEQQISLLDFWEQFIYNKNNGANAKKTGKGNKNYGIKYTRFTEQSRMGSKRV